MSYTITIECNFFMPNSLNLNKFKELNLNIMKAFLNFLFVLIIISIFSSGCEKENSNPEDNNLVPDKNALRISKMAYDIGMENPWLSFEYNEKGLVTEIKHRNYDDLIYITYNEDDLPVKIVWIKDPIGGDGGVYTTEIVWVENSYTATA